MVKIRSKRSVMLIRLTYSYFSIQSVSQFLLFTANATCVMFSLQKLEQLVGQQFTCRVNNQRIVVLKDLLQCWSSLGDVKCYSAKDQHDRWDVLTLNESQLWNVQSQVSRVDVWKSKSYRLSSYETHRALRWNPSVTTLVTQACWRCINSYIPVKEDVGVNGWVKQTETFNQKLNVCVPFATKSPSVVPKVL